MPTERIQAYELDPNLISAYAATFIPREDLYPLQLKNGRYTHIKGTLLPSVAAHLKGLFTIGAYALDTSNHAKWLCFDADDEEKWQHLQHLSAALATQHIPSYLELSRRGGHLWLFFSPLSGGDARRLGTQLLIEYGISPVEIYPKQDKLQTGPGSFVRLPLGKHRLTERRYHFVTPTREPLAPTIRAQIALLAQPQHVPQAFIDQMLSRSPEAKPLSPTPTFQEQKKKHRKARRTKHGKRPSERIKAAVSVFEFVSQYVELDAQGRGYCPFHNDEHKSFGVNQDRNYWHCFAGCLTSDGNKGGSVIDFWMKWRDKQGEDGSFTATITDLADRLLD